MGLGWVRQRQRVLTKAVLALFALAWLQAAALPCVMAHTGAEAPAPAVHDCIYCPPQSAPAGDCADDGACAYPHEPAVDARVAATLFVALPTLGVVLPEASAGHALEPLESSAAGPIPRIPFAVSYCRYLE
jgi:hypothetical protein